MTAIAQQTDLCEVITLIPGYDPFASAGDCAFDEQAAQLAIDFFHECLHHIEGAVAGQPFILEPWEQAIVANLFGWKKPDGTRRYREALIYVPRKNGKTPLTAGIGDYVLFCDNEIGQQDYCAAGEREQASLLFRHAAGMVRAEPELESRCTIYGEKGTTQNRTIHVEATGSFLKVLSAEADTKHGANPHLVVVDELHVQKNRRLIDALTTSMSSANRLQPLLIYLTTADYMRPTICNEVYDYACKVRDGIIEDAAFLPVIYEATPADDWTDPAVWARVNPNLGVSVSEDYLHRECKKAQEFPSKENEFKRLHLNIRTEQDIRWLPMDKWDAVDAGTDPAAWRAEMLAKLAGKKCIGGLDLGSTGDLTALGLLFDAADAGIEDGGYVLLPFFWVPADSARKRERKDRVPYPAWIKTGYITPSAGDAMDYDFVRRDINKLADRYPLIDLAADRLFQGDQLVTQLREQDGLNVVAFGQGFLSMAAPTKKFEELVIAKKIHHGNNPVLRWMASNVTVEMDAAGNIKPSKKKSTEKIDGIVTAIMAIGRAMANVHGTSIYEERGPLVFDV